MKWFQTKRPKHIPAPFSAKDIRIESSICTGERTIGFYDKSSKKLLYAELVRSEQDIEDFYAEYGVKHKSDAL